jgi:sporulation protein YlmC with PRC-barrel domain
MIINLNDTVMNNLEKENKYGENLDGPHANTPLRVLTATSIIGDKVKNKSGELIGAIKDIMIDIHSWKLEYIVLETGGFLGIGEKLFAIPYANLTVNPLDHSFILDVDKKFMEKAPGFDKGHWPETNNHWIEVNRHWASFMGPNVGGM